jgi:hypothetical protein
MSEAVKISYSSASAFKACPEKYYLQRDWKVKGNFSYFVFGSAIEAGVTEALLNRDREKMLEAFEKNWSCENAGSSSTSEFKKEKPIFDNVDIEYSVGDIDLDLLEGEDVRLDQWVTELFNDVTLTWKPLILGIFSKIKNKIELTEVEDRFYKRIAWVSMKKKGEIMLNSFFDQALPKIKGLVSMDGKPAVQVRIDISSDTGDSLIGYADYIVELQDGRIVILDCKTAASAYEEHSLLTSEQLKTYAAALASKFPTTPEIGYLVLIKKLSVEKSCSSCGHIRENSKFKNCTACEDGKYDVNSYSAAVQLITRKIEEKEMDKQLEDYSQVANAIRNNIRFKNPASCFNFGRKCEFYDYCHKGVELSQIPELERK